MSAHSFSLNRGTYMGVNVIEFIKRVGEKR